MGNQPRKIRIPRPLYPWSDVANQFDDPVQLYVNRVLQDLERIKLEIATVNATGGVYGDILVADINRTFQPQKYVPLNLGVGLSANPTYRLQVQDGEVNFHFTQSASGGAYGITLGRAASGTSHLAYMFASGDVVLWEIGFDSGGNLILRSQLNATNALVSDASGDIIIRRNLDVGRNLTVTGDTVLFGNVTTGPLVANTLQVTGTSFLFGTTTTGPLIANTLQVTGSAWLFGNVKTGPLTANTLQVTGSSWLFGNANTGPLTCNSLVVTGSAVVSGNCTVSGNLTVVGNVAVTGSAAFLGQATASGGLAVAGTFGHTGTKFGVRNVQPVVMPASYTVTNSTPTRSYDESLFTITTLGNVVAALIKDLLSQGIVDGSVT